jgi:hypothetical protein
MDYQMASVARSPVEKSAKILTLALTSMMSAVVAILLLRGSALAADSKSVYVSPAEIEQIHAVSAKIRAACPPEDCVVIGVGRSPTPFILDLQNQHPNYAYGVPMSQFRSNLEVEHMTKVLGETPIVDYRKLTQAAEARLNTHLDRYVPSAVKNGRRRALVVDYSYKGGFSAFAFQKYLERYLTGKGSASEVSSLVLADSGTGGDVARIAPLYRAQRYSVIEITDASELREALKQSKYDLFSPYGRFDLSTGETTPGGGGEALLRRQLSGGPRFLDRCLSRLLGKIGGRGR